MNKYLILLIKISVSGILLYLIFKKIDFQMLKESLKQGNPSTILAAVMVGIVFNLVKFRKWHNLIRANDLGHTYWEGAKSYMIGNALGIVTPMRAGDLSRALYFKPVERPKIVGFTIVDRLLDLVAVIVFCIGGGFILINPGFGLLLTSGSVISLMIVYNPKFLHNFFDRLLGRGTVSQKLSKVTDTLNLLDRNLLTRSLLLSFVAFFLIIVQFYFMISAFEKITLFNAFLATPLITLSTLIPITFMGLGVREGLAIYLFSMLNITSATAFSTAFLCFVINNVSTGIIGIVYLVNVQSRLN